MIKTEAINTVVFDIGNVLTDFGWEPFLRRKGFDDEMVERIGNATTRSATWNELDRGVLTTQEIIDGFVANDPGIEKEIRYAFSDLSGILVARERTVPWIRALKAAGYKVLVLSNYSKQAEEACPEAIAFLSEVDGGILSYKEKVIKPDPEIYKRLCERYDLIPERTVFIDDTERNIIAARNLGWHGIVFKNYEQVESELRSMGVDY
ncbi:MAG: HAD family phosphatase [Butyrivibrio sp.]|nr:HAD family phosphatase [Butyrivibrio sp.]